MMLKNIIKPGSILLMLAVVFAGFSAFAQSNGIKAQMRARLPIIDALKGEGVIGETNDGYVAFVGQKKMKEDVIAAENQDRRKVYEAIAKQQGTTPEVVGNMLIELCRIGIVIYTANYYMKYFSPEAPS